MPLDPSSGSQKYLVRDPQGNVYGPADAEMLRQWVREGRIVPGMHVAPRETREWVEVSVHPELAGALAVRAAELGTGVNDLPATDTLSSASSDSAPAHPAPAETPAPVDPVPAAPVHDAPASAPASDVIDAELVTPASPPREEPAVEMVPVSDLLPESDKPADTSPAETPLPPAIPAEPTPPATEPIPTAYQDSSPAPLLHTPSAPETETPSPSWSTPSAPYPMTPAPQSPHDLAYARPSRQNVMGILSLTFGALSVPLSCGACGCVLFMPLAGLLALAAVVLGAIGLSQIKANPAAFHGKGLATAGLVIGATIISLYILGFIVTVVLNLGTAFSGP